ncbi:MAG: putative glycoside hydrolase [Oscillospiraceae bacterium]
MGNNENKGVKIQHHRYNNGSRRGKRKLHKGRVAGAILSLVLVIGLGFGGYKLVDKLSTIGDSDSISTNLNIPNDGNTNDTSNSTNIVTVSPSVETIVTTTTTPITTISSTSTTTTLATIIDGNGNIVIPDSTQGYDKNYSNVDSNSNNNNQSGNGNSNDDDNTINYSTNSNDTSQSDNNSNGNNNGNTITTNVDNDTNINNSQNGDTTSNGSNNNSNSSTTDNNSSNNNNSNNYDDVSVNNSNSYYLSEDDISSEDTLKTALNKVDSSYNIVVLPLKSQGGMLNYGSKINSAINSGVVGSYTDLKDLVKLIKDAGFIPYASISVLYDNIYPQTYKKSAYQFEDGTGSWWDNSEENGGKPWLSPFSEDTKNYLSAISAELTEDGIEGIICEDVIFPNFREKDLDYIGDLVKDENRYTALIDVLNTIQKSANGQEVLFKFSLVDALKGKVEALKSDELNSNLILTPHIVLSDLSSTFSYGGNSISLSSQSTYNKVKLSMELFEKMSGNLKVVPSIDVSSLTASQKKDVISALEDMGYNNYLLQ